MTAQRDWPAHHDEERNGKCVSKHFLCLIDRYRKVALGRKKAGQNCQISVGKIICWKNALKKLTKINIYNKFWEKSFKKYFKKWTWNDVEIIWKKVKKCSKHGLKWPKRGLNWSRIFFELLAHFWRFFYLLIVASRRATCNKTLPVRIFLNTEIASAWDIPWRAKPLTAKISSPIKKRNQFL